MKILRAGEKQKGSPKDLKRLLAYASPYSLQLAGALTSLVIATVLSLVYPQLVRKLIDAAFSGQDASQMNLIAIMLLSLFAFQALFSFLRTYLLVYTGERIVADVRVQLYKHLTSMTAAFFAERRVGELTSRLASDVSIIQIVAASSITEVIRVGLMLVGGLTIILITNPRLTLVMLAIVPVLFLSATIYGRYVKRISTQVQDKVADSISVIQEALSAIRLVQSFVREEYERERYRRRIMDAFQLAVRRAVAAGGFIAFIVFAIYGGISVVLWFGSRMVLAREITPGELMAFVLYTFVVGSSVSGLSELYGQVQQAIGATRRVFELLDTKPDIVSPPNPEPFDEVRGEVEIRDVHFTYPDKRGIEVLKGVNIHARRGDIIALVGPSGAGKSTLVTLLPRFYDVSSGAVFIDGHDTRSVRLSELREAIGVVPQETTLFGGTIRENIAYGRLDATEAEIQAAAKAAHAHGFIMECPEGYETVVGERGVKLSGGQRQRLAIARALLKDPKILILDEATSSLDTDSERLVQAALETLMENRTTFVIAHRLSTVRRADRIIVLEDGRIVEEGTHEELILRAGLYEQLHNSQFGEYPAAPAAAAEALNSLVATSEQPIAG